MSVSDQFWKKAILPINSSIKEAIRNLDEVAIKIVLVINESGMFEGTLSDGDIRRGLLQGLGLNSSIENIIHRNALIVPPELPKDQVMQLMTSNKIQQIPVVDKNHQIIGLYLWDKINEIQKKDNLMIIMAGGMGTRLHPYTKSCPKPLIPIAGKPMLEHIIDRAKLDGFNQFIISINYLGHMIEDYFGDGTKFGIQIDYLKEKFPLGTAGAISLLKTLPKKDFIVTNGDVITDISYGEILDFHVRYSASATMAVRTHEWQQPFGVVQIDGIRIISLEEKPVSHSYINAGVYVLNPEALTSLVFEEHCDMPVLFERLMEKGKQILAYPLHEPWLDVGKPEDLKKALSKINLGNEL